VNCAGGSTSGTPAVNWQAHNQGQNILFMDGHVKWYRDFDANEMTFRYDHMEVWRY
jgi:prepilin-type processing-associated H-X9-DG protein